MAEKKRWTYYSENVGGNVHAAVAWINTDHPDWDVVTIVPVGGASIIVRREEVPRVR